MSDWKSGSNWNHQRSDGTDILDILGKAIEFSSPKKVVMARARSNEEDGLANHTRMTIDFQPCTEALARLTVTHAELNESMLDGIAGGGLAAPCNLKTLLETGRPPPQTPAPHRRKARMTTTCDGVCRCGRIAVEVENEMTGAMRPTVLLVNASARRCALCRVYSFE